jgi:hypothetical protein
LRKREQKKGFPTIREPASIMPPFGKDDGFHLGRHRELLFGPIQWDF